MFTQLKHPLAFLSKSLSQRNQSLSVYDKEMFAILFAVDKWRHYILGRPFTILTDHQTLKHLLDQRISTPSQHKWLSKLMGYNYKIQFCAGPLNTVPDILFRTDELCPIQAISSPVFDSVAAIDRACSQDLEAQAIVLALQQAQPTKKGFSLLHGSLHYKDKILVPSTSDWRFKILSEFHLSLQAGHSGYLHTFVRLARNFSWTSMRKDVKRFVVACDQCQWQNYETLKPPGLLHPLPVPDTIWVDISMDFINGLPISQGKNVILVVVDRLSKYAHFIAISHPYTAIGIVDIFLKEIFQLYGMPRSIVSDRDPIFTSHFWETLFKLQGTKICISPPIGRPIGSGQPFY